MAKINPVFQSSVFQDNAFQDEVWGGYVFQRSVFQGKKRGFLFQENVFQDNAFAQTTTVDSPFDVVPVILKIINESISLAETDKRTRGLIRLANESVTIEVFRV